MSRKNDFIKVINDWYSGKYSDRIPWDERKYMTHVYHFTDMKNAISILQTGNIFSRNQAELLGLMSNDNASSEVILGTDSKVKDYVRFYFRPKTPTQFINQGVLSKEELERSAYKAHCPIPVFFLFKSFEVLARNDAYFTEESLAKHYDVQLFNTVEEFSEMPFELIYHSRSLYNLPNKQEIIAHRHAEVIVKDKFSIERLSSIVVRSTAEKEFLLSSLTDNEKEKYVNLIRVDNKKVFFCNSGAYVLGAILNFYNISLTFNPGDDDPLFTVYVEIEDSEKGKYYWGPNRIKLSEMPIIDISKLRLEHYEVKVSLDSIIVYKNRYDMIIEDIPF